MSKVIEDFHKYKGSVAGSFRVGLALNRLGLPDGFFHVEVSFTHPNDFKNENTHKELMSLYQFGEGLLLNDMTGIIHKWSTPSNLGKNPKNIIADFNNAAMIKRYFVIDVRKFSASKNPGKEDFTYHEWSNRTQKENLVNKNDPLFPQLREAASQANFTIPASDFYYKIGVKRNEASLTQLLQAQGMDQGQIQEVLSYAQRVQKQNMLPFPATQLILNGLVTGFGLTNQLLSKGS